MRKSTVIMMGILLAAFGVLLAAADATLKPLAADAAISKELTRDLQNQRRVEPETKVSVLRVGASPRRLAEEGRGLLIHLRPRQGRDARERSRRQGRLSRLASAVARQATGAYIERFEWVEVVFEVGEERRATLLRLDEDGGLGRPSPSPDLPPAPPGKAATRTRPQTAPRGD